MAEPDLAPREYQDKKDTRIYDDPFANPRAVSSTSPTFPPPCAQSSVNAASPHTAAVNGGYHARYDRYGPQAASISYKPGSTSSDGDSTLMTPMSSMDLEKASLAKEQGPRRGSRESKQSKGSRTSGGTKDPEKAMNGSRANSHQSSHRNVSSAVAAYLEDEEPDDGQRTQEAKALKILLFMSGPAVVLSAVNTAWACVALVITALSQPIRLCAKRPTFGQQLAGLLGPTLNLQLRYIYTPLPPYANEDASYHTFMLAVIHIFSPFLAFAMMFAAWTLAVYWMSSKIVGDPAGQDNVDDGRETVLGLRRWWERWLMRSVQEQ